MTPAKEISQAVTMQIRNTVIKKSSFCRVFAAQSRILGTKKVEARIKPTMITVDRESNSNTELDISGPDIPASIGIMKINGTTQMS